MGVSILHVDYHNPQHAKDLLALLDHYARDPMGGGDALSDYARTHLISALAQRPHACSVLCYVDGQAAGLANCFEGFSTFASQPLLNIHDFVVHQDFRGYGISQTLLTALEALARARGCCKLTLEVLSGNHRAQAAYRKFGFAAYELEPAQGQALFWQKTVSCT